MSVCYRDAWATAQRRDSGHRADAGHTFTPENWLTVNAEAGELALELGRRIDYIFVRGTDHGPTLDVRAAGGCSTCRSTRYGRATTSA
jgi:hypothetical protein